MFKSYFKIAWRNLVRQKVFSSINVTGLALGLTCSMLIMLWVHDERSIDGFHVNAPSLYHVYERNFYEGKVEAGYSTQGLLAGELKRVVPEIQYASGFEYVAPPGTKSTFSAGDKVNKMTGFYTGEDYFAMFSYPLLEGTVAGVLSLPGTVAVSREMAEYFFDDARTALGKTLLFDDQEELKISGVFENITGRSSLQFDFLRPWKDFEKANPWIHNWGNTSPATYIQLRKDADAATVETKIRDFIYRYKKEDPTFKVELALQPYAERYLHSNLSKGYVDGGRIEYVRLFTAVAIFILLIACINFMSLATAQSEKRAREVGLRKVVGAARFSLVLQFIGEALLLTLLAGMIALAAVALLLPAFNTITGKQLELPFDSVYFWMGIAGLLLSTGILAGSYPALFLSSLKPVKVLKGAQKFNWKSSFFRQGLVVVQFVLAMVLIIGTIVTYRQMQYIQEKNIGYERDNLLYIPIEGELQTQYTLFKQRAMAMPGVADISKMRNSPTVIEHHTNSISWPGKPENITVSFADGVVGYDFVRTMKLELKEGRDFSPAFGIDSAAYILNETAVEKMGLSDPLGKTVSWGGRNGTVIGILKDFHFNSMHHAIEPLILRLDENWGWGTVMVRLQGGNIGNTIASLQNLCRDINPRFPFSYQFSDAEFGKLYRSEQVVSRLSRYFAFLAIFISCLGLYGLAAFVAAQRTKEIGVRKVLGASVPGIVTLLSGSFLKLVGIALLVAFPLGGLILQRWLNQFAYKTGIEWWVFVVAGLFAIIVAVITISFQSIKAAMANPVKSLRTE
ncbi:MAG: ABC transporter permease [Chitinophagaceae bacterium]|nr:ABC transporter permease [Chitinophagaceae bacterium]MCW5926717.1 ABC transporter permease [Chitinophagaceae bacterium]